ncbi:hypothetical protein ACWEPB_26545 [Kitasatospora cineracea]
MTELVRPENLRFLSDERGMLICMNASEQQDDRDEVQDDREWDGGEAEATSVAAPLVTSPPMIYDLLKPLNDTLASTSTGHDHQIAELVAPFKSVELLNAVRYDMIAESLQPMIDTINAIKLPPLQITGVAEQIAQITSPFRASDWLNDTAVSAIASIKLPPLQIMGAAEHLVQITSKLPPTFLGPEQIAELVTPLESLGLLNAVRYDMIAESLQPMIDTINAIKLPPLQIMGAAEHLVQITSPLLQTAQIVEGIRKSFSEGLFSELVGFLELVKDWLPDNLADLDEEQLESLRRLAQEDGACLAWAPRTQIVAALLALPTAAARQQYLIDHRLEVVEDVEANLEKVDHPDLLDLRDLTLKAAACLRDGHDAPAQALLGNVLDTLMRAHGNSWLRSHFPDGTFPPNPNTSSHKVIAGVLGAYTGLTQLRRIPAMLLVTAMQDMFSSSDLQATFNRHLAAHKASAHTYRSGFAFTALLNTQALLHLVDRYLYAST